MHAGATNTNMSMSEHDVWYLVTPGPCELNNQENLNKPFTTPYQIFIITNTMVYKPKIQIFIGTV